MAGEKLTKAQVEHLRDVATLGAMATSRGSGWWASIQLAYQCGASHEWTQARLRRMRRRGLVEVSSQLWRMTSLGRALLQGGDDGR